MDCTYTRVRHPSEREKKIYIPIDLDSSFFNTSSSSSSLPYARMER
jgi:hypothetical protein